MLLRSSIVWLFALCLSAPTTGGCLLSQSDAESSAVGDPSPPENDDGFDGAGNVQCELASDCVLAASTCCECPSFAVPVGQGYDGGCEDVDCEPSGLCPAVEAICDTGQCVLVCSPVITDQICAFGFVRDAGGCLTNECAAAPEELSASCSADEECVQIPADCCGCSQGGEDKAVPASQEADELDALSCPPDPACPDIDVCDAEQVPRCIGGTCVLTAENPQDPMPPSEPGADEEVLCGTPELAACPSGSQCVLNDLSAKEADSLGVGLCVDI